MHRGLQLELCTLLLALLVVVPTFACAWNIPGHMISGTIAYRILQQENPAAVAAIQAILKKHPWYVDRWRDEIARQPEPYQTELLFMLAARWPDDIRTQARTPLFENRWHYIQWPFKPAGEPDDIKPVPQLPANIITAIADNERIVRSNVSPDQRGIALAWLFHLVGDIHLPLHTVQMFTREYPNGDRGGNEMCVRVTPDRPAPNLHRLWDGLVTSTNNVSRLRGIATELFNPLPLRTSLPELEQTQPEAWARESYEIATKIAYQNGALRGTPKGGRNDCREVTEAAGLPDGYASRARLIANRRMVVSSYRLVSQLIRSVGSN